MKSMSMSPLKARLLDKLDDKAIGNYIENIIQNDILDYIKRRKKNQGTFLNLIKIHIYCSRRGIKLFKLKFWNEISEENKKFISSSLHFYIQRYNLDVTSE